MFTWLNTYTVFDLETTGLSVNDGAEIIEIGAVKIISGEITDQRYECFVSPARSVPAIATKISGITNEMLEGQPKIREVLPEFLEWIGDDILVAQNHTFDMGFVMNHCRELGLSYAGNEVMDTMLLWRKLFPGEKANLDHMLKQMNLQSPKKRHRALDDSLATAELFILLMKKLEAKDEDPFATLKPANKFKV